MDFKFVLEQVLARFHEEDIDCALIGGFALAALGVARTTVDIDFLVPGECSDRISRIMSDLGYTELHRSADAANYVAADSRLGRVDFLFARRPYTKAMLERARSRGVGQRQVVKAVEAEDVVGLKVQASSNDPRRMHLDLADIERLLDAYPNLDLGRVREYFRLFGREAELDELLEKRR